MSRKGGSPTLGLGLMVGGQMVASFDKLLMIGKEEKGEGGGKEEGRSRMLLINAHPTTEEKTVVQAFPLVSISRCKAHCKR